MQAVAEVEAVVPTAVAKPAAEAAIVAAAEAGAVIAEAAADADSTAERALTSIALLLLGMRPERTRAEARSLAVEPGQSSGLQQPQGLQQHPRPDAPAHEQQAAGGECRRGRSAGRTGRLLRLEGARSAAAVAVVAARFPPEAV